LKIIPKNIQLKSMFLSSKSAKSMTVIPALPQTKAKTWARRYI